MEPSPQEQPLQLICWDTSLGWIAVAYRQEENVLIVEGLTFGHSSKERARLALDKKFRRVAGHAVSRSTSANSCGWDSAELTAPSSVLDDRVLSLKHRLDDYAAGVPVDFADVRTDDSHLTPFARRTVAACRRVGWGQTCTYGQLAASCGHARAARAVGQVMAGNRCPLIVPCHRVVSAGGRLGGFSAPHGLQMKRRLLRLESVPLTHI